jgi:hypothetical protein
VNSEIVEKIKKLLRLGQSTNPHEAALALERAFDLAARHHVDVSALELDDDVEKLVSEWFKVGERLSFLQQRALALCVSFFNVAVCVARPRVVFVGTPSDVTIAWYVYGFICQQGRSWLRVYEIDERLARRRVTRNKRANFVQGFIYGIALQVGNRRRQLVIEDSKTAIVLAEQEKARNAYMDDVVPNRTLAKRELKRELRGPLMTGFARGQETRINAPLRGPEKLALTA